MTGGLSFLSKVSLDTQVWGIQDIAERRADQDIQVGQGIRAYQDTPDNQVTQVLGFLDTPVHLDTQVRVRLVIQDKWDSVDTLESQATQGSQVTLVYRDIAELE